MFVYKHTERIEHVKKVAYFLTKTQTSREITQESSGLRMQTFSGIAFM